jgi:DNA-binding SARP family transcriptional activator/tetratricopeptide (TPR) repeat protein
MQESGGGVIYGLLGELEIQGAGGPLELPGGLALAVLAALLINVNRRVSKADLIRVAWGSTGTTEAQLHKAVQVVRQTLEGVGRRDDIRTHARFGYELRADEEDVDVLVFQRLVRQAEEAAAARRVDEEINCLRGALRLWRGPRPLSNVRSGALNQDILMLLARHKRAAVRLFTLELDQGNHEGILDELALAAAVHPSDQRLCEQLMIARYRCDYLSDATAAYETYRDALAADTAASPDSLLKNLYFAIARTDEAAIATAMSAIDKRAGRGGQPARAAVPVPRQLPRPADLVGRAQAAAEVSGLLRGAPGGPAPVVVISGPGGVGKTALAVRTAHDVATHYPDGQLYADLQGASPVPADTDAVLARFLRALGASYVPETRHELQASFRSMLAGRRVLIVLDDAADGAQVADLLPGSDRCSVLVTARRRLPDLTDARHVAPLSPLGPADATALFKQVITSGGITLEPAPDAVAQVVALCGGLPLALRIAGAIRVHDHPRPTSELARRLASLGPSALEYGELSVARTIGTGLERLDPDARGLFLGLGHLRLPRFGTWTAAALLPDGADGAAALSRLAARFVIEPTETGHRYRFHDLTWEYVKRRAQAGNLAGQADIPAQAYRALLTLARRAHSRLYGGDYEVVHSDVPDWDAPAEALAEVDAGPLEWFERERLNIRAAVEHCAELGLTAICWDLAVSAHEFYTVRGHFDDWYATHRAALGACRAAGDLRGEGIVLVCVNQPALVSSRRIAPTADLTELWRAASLLRDCDDRHALAIALRTLANALRRQGHVSRSLPLLSEALGYYRDSGDVVGQWQAQRYIGQIYTDLGDHRNARRALDAAETIAAELGDSRVLAQTRYWTGQACLAAGDMDGAAAAFDAVWDVYCETTGLGLVYALHGLGDLELRTGRLGAAERRLELAAKLAADLGDAVIEGRVALSVAELRRVQGRPAERAAALERAASVFAGCGAVYLEVRALAELATLAQLEGNAIAADSLWARIDSCYGPAGPPAEDRVRRPRLGQEPAALVRDAVA